MAAAAVQSRTIVAVVALATAVLVGCTTLHGPSSAPRPEAFEGGPATAATRSPAATGAPVVHASRPASAGAALVPATAYVLAVVGGHLRIIHLDGSGVRIAVPTVDVPEDSDVVMAGDWSPDGRRLTFTRVHHDPEPVRSSLWVAASNGDAARELVRCVSPCQRAGLGAWSPDGDRIAYAVSELGTTAKPARSAIEVVAVASGRRHVVTETTDPDDELAWPRWSPDGRRLVVQITVRPAASASSATPAARSPRIAVVDLAQPPTQVPRVLAATVPGSHPDWSWRSDLIVFATNDPHIVDGDADRNLWTVRPDGTGLHEVTHYRSPAAAVHPSWTPGGVILFEHCEALPACFVAYASADGSLVQTPERLPGRWPRLQP
ncbi:hypothetical protein GCM10009817_21110 [Terrabacter lapilli]|uniref:WD40 repeat protein n=1 Tax=Terrabacter lapilli TaxID=436231 RepID=A0ABN2S4G5_9MICO